MFSMTKFKMEPLGIINAFLIALLIRPYQKHLAMKKPITMLIVAMVAMAMTSCNSDSNYKELIVGKWEVKTYRLWVHDLTDEDPWTTGDSYSQEETWNLPDTSYSGYDAAEFNADGTMRWHMSDRMVNEGAFSDPYVDANWYISGDSLIINETKYAIREIDKETLVIEDYYKVNSYQSHHGWERTNCYTFKRAK